MRLRLPDPAGGGIARLDPSMLADWVGASAATLMRWRRSPSMSSLASASMLRTPRCRFWPRARRARAGCGSICTMMRPSAAVYYYSPDRGEGHREHYLAGYSGLPQADAYAGFNGLYVAGRKPGPITEAACWAHGRRKFYELVELRKAPLAIEALRRIDELFAIERSTVSLRISVSPSAASDRSRAATRWKPGCGRSAASSPPATR